MTKEMITMTDHDELRRGVDMLVADMLPPGPLRDRIEDHIVECDSCASRLAHLPDSDDVYDLELPIVQQRLAADTDVTGDASKRLEVEERVREQELGTSGIRWHLVRDEGDRRILEFVTREPRLAGAVLRFFIDEEGTVSVVTRRLAELPGRRWGEMLVTSTRAAVSCQLQPPDRVGHPPRHE